MADQVLIDPLGRQIVLNDHTWFWHILKRHPDMQPYRDLLVLAVTNPLEIRISDADPLCRIYFGVGPKSGRLIAVVADLNLGRVKTAHIIRSAKGVLEWSRPTL